MDFSFLEIEPSAQNAAREAVPATAPTDAAACYRVAGEMRRAGLFRSATGYYAKTVGMDDRNFNAWVEYIDTLTRSRQLDEAEHLSARILDAYRMVRVLYASRALVLAHRGLLQDAFKHSDASLSEGEPHFYPRCVRAELLLRAEPGSRRNREDALALLDQAAQAGGAWDVYFAGGCTLMDTGWPAYAAGCFAEAAHRDPRGAAAWLCLGDCFYSLRLYDQALFYYQLAASMEPNLIATVGRRQRASKWRFGLMRIFDRRTLQMRWEERFNLQQQTGSAIGETER